MSEFDATKLPEGAQKLLENIIAKYKTSDDLELELRFRGITKDVFENIYKESISGKHKVELEQSINFITKGMNGQPPPQLIRKLLFENGELIKEEKVKKQLLARPVFISDYLDYTINLSSETDAGPFKTSPDALARFKIRVSI